jgi:hypothetical protein
VTYNAGTIVGLAASTGYYIYAVDPNYVGGAVAWQATTVLTTAMAADNIYLGRFSTQAGGGGGYTPPREWCVSAAMMLRSDLCAADARVGDLIDVMDDAGLYLGRMPIESIEFDEADCVELVAEVGARVIVSRSAPVVLMDGPTVRAENVVVGDLIATMEDHVFMLRQVRSVQPAGVRQVAKIHVGGISYAAGVDPRARIYTHNPTYKP